MSGPDAPVPDPSIARREAELAKQKEELGKKAEDQRIKNLRQRNGAASLFSDNQMPPGNTLG